MTPQQQKLFDDHLRFARGIAGNRSIVGMDKAAIRQEAFMALQKAVEAYDAAQGKFEPFAAKVIHNQLNDAFRKAKRIQREVTSLDDDDENWDAPKYDIPDREPNPASEAERNEIRRALQASLESITPEQRFVLEGRAVGRSYAEMARETGSSEQAVRQMLERGAKQMRPELESRGISGPKFMPSGDHFSRALPQAANPITQPRPPLNPEMTVLIAVLAVIAIVLFVLWLFHNF